MPFATCMLDRYIIRGCGKGASDAVEHLVRSPFKRCSSHKERCPKVSIPVEQWTNMPERFCNLERILDIMDRNNIDGLVLQTRHNVYYTTGFWLNSMHADEPYPCAFILSRRLPNEPTVVVGDVMIANFVYQDTWVSDIRPYRLPQLVQFDIPLDQQPLSRFVPEGGAAAPWYANAERAYEANWTSLADACTAALKDLGLDRGVVGVDNLQLQGAIEAAGAEVVDAYWHMMDARHVKTAPEIELLKEATLTNQAAQERMVREWQPDMTWRETYSVYNEEARNLGGHVEAPAVSTMSTICPGRCFMVSAATEPDIKLEPGTNVILDCHGMRNGYCWDGGKTWRIGELVPEGSARSRLEAAASALQEINAACKPGVTARDVQAVGRSVLRKHGIHDADEAMIYIHGVGLSHVDQNMADPDWAVEENAVLASHIYVPGGPEDRVWIEDVLLVTPEGGERFFTWDYVDWPSTG